MPAAGLPDLTCPPSCCDEIDDAAALFELQNDRRYAPTNPGLEDRKRVELQRNERKALMIRLRDWIHDVHDCGPAGYQGDDELADSLVLFVEQEIERAVHGAPRCGNASESGLACEREPHHSGLHRAKFDGHLHKWAS